MYRQNNGWSPASALFAVLMFFMLMFTAMDPRSVSEFIQYVLGGLL